MKKKNLVLLCPAIAAALVSGAKADVIPYANAGTPNPNVYNFTASTSADVIAYFAGGAAADEITLGLLRNGVSTGIVGLDNHNSSIGTSIDLGTVTAGDTLTFVFNNLTLGKTAYSNPALNSAYDFNNFDGHNHIYSTAYTASPAIGTIPPGTYVGFEDHPFSGADYNYADETFVFTNVATAIVPEPASLSLLGLASFGLLTRRRRD